MPTAIQENIGGRTIFLDQAIDPRVLDELILEFPSEGDISVRRAEGGWRWEVVESTRSRDS